MAQTAKIYINSSLDEPLRQGEILSALTQLPLDPDNIDLVSPTIKPIIHPWAIIVSQDCDLDWDFKARQSGDESQLHKLLPNMLFCMITTAEDLRGRTDINSGIWGRIKTNKDERYHFFQKAEAEDDLLGDGLPELAVDFKRYFSIPTNEVYFQLQHDKARRRTRLLSPYLEHFSTRFAYFQSRIALPEDHFSE